MKKILMIPCIVSVIAFFLTTCAFSGDLSPIRLPKPQMNGGKPLMEALKERKTSREFNMKALPPQMLSNLLWAAFGINRPDTGKRTAPSARNRQEIDIYIADATGVYRYDAAAHALTPIILKDIRAKTGKQAFVSHAALNLIYVANLSKMGDSSIEEKRFYAAAGTGFISQNVYLFCASEGLSTVVRGSLDRKDLAWRINLKPDQEITLAQTVGFPLTRN